MTVICAPSAHRPDGTAGRRAETWLETGTATPLRLVLGCSGRGRASSESSSAACIIRSALPGAVRGRSMRGLCGEVYKNASFPTLPRPPPESVPSPTAFPAESPDPSPRTSRETHEARGHVAVLQPQGEQRQLQPRQAVVARSPASGGRFAAAPQETQGRLGMQHVPEPQVTCMSAPRAPDGRGQDPGPGSDGCPSSVMEAGRSVPCARNWVVIVCTSRSGLRPT